MFKIAIQPGWHIQGAGAEASSAVDTSLLLRLLASIRESGSIAAAGWKGCPPVTYGASCAAPNSCSARRCWRSGRGRARG